MDVNVAMCVTSVNPLTRKSYIIPPSDSSDREGIDRFLSDNEGKSVIVVQGLGFVGAAMALVCANAGDGKYAVIGIDLPTVESYWKVASINEGICPIVSGDPKVEELFQLAMDRKNLYATTDPYVYEVADNIIVDINLDVAKISDENGNIIDYSVNPSPLIGSATVIGKNCKPNALVLVETTVPPGSCVNIFQKTICYELEARGLSADDIAIGHSYERVMPGPGYINSIINFYRVFSGVDSRSADRTEAFLKSIINTSEYPLTKLASTTASESAKILENSYRALNIAFVEEWGRFAEEAGFNLHEVVDAIRLRPTHANLMYPGLGVGGYCLTKDPLLASWARENQFKSVALTKSVASVESNDKMPRNFYSKFQEFSSRTLSESRVLILGVSYRSEVADTRYTPVQVVYEGLNNDGAEVVLHDFYVGYWEECDCAVETRLSAVLDRSYDSVIICTGHSQYRENELLLHWLETQDGLDIVDAVAVLSEPSIARIRKRNRLWIVGRGDI